MASAVHKTFDDQAYIVPVFNHRKFQRVVLKRGLPVLNSPSKTNAYLDK